MLTSCRRRGKQAEGHRCGNDPAFVQRNGRLADWLPALVETLRTEALQAEEPGAYGPPEEFTAELAARLCELPCPYCKDIELLQQLRAGEAAAKAAKRAAKAKAKADKAAGNEDVPEAAEADADIDEEIDADDAVIPPPHSGDEDSDAGDDGAGMYAMEHDNNDVLVGPGAEDLN